MPSRGLLLLFSLFGCRAASAPRNPEHSSARVEALLPGLSDKDAILLPNGDILAALESGVARLDGHSGETVWRLPRPTACDGRKTIVAGKYVVTGSGHTADDLYTECLDVSTGQVLWSAKGNCLAAAASGPDGSLLFIAVTSFQRRGELVALDSATWTVAWRHPLSMEGTGLLVEGHRLFLVEYEPLSCATALCCLDVMDGRPLWKANVTGIHVDHSYYSQSTSTEIRGDHVILSSAQTAGMFVEVFRKEDGAAVSKWRSLY